MSDDHISIPGVLWPWMPEGMEDLPYVQRDDESDLYADDIEAAQAVAKLIDMPVMFVMDEHAGVDGNGEPIPIKPDDWHHHLRPFVLPRMDNLPDTKNCNFDFWLAACQLTLRNKEA